MARRLFPVIYSMLAACLPSVDGFEIGPGIVEDGGTSDSGPVPDSGAPGPATDAASGGPRCLPEPTCEDGCPMPWILAGIQALPGAPCNDAIARYSVVSEHELCTCTGYETGLPENLGTVAFLPPSTILAGSLSGQVTALDATSGMPRWSRQPEPALNARVVSLAPFRTGDGTLAVAVGLDDGRSIIQVRLLRSDDGEPLRAARSTLPGRFGQSSRAEGAVRSLGFTQSLIRDVDPEFDRLADYLPATNGTVFENVRSHWVSFPSGPVHRSTATGRQEGESAVFALRHPPSTPSVLPSPSRCASMACDFEDATAHPFRGAWSFATCRQGSEVSLVRMYNFSECDTILEGATLGSQMLIRSVELALPGESWAAGERL